VTAVIPYFSYAKATRRTSPGATSVYAAVTHGLLSPSPLAVTWDALDLDEATVEVRGTVVRIKGQGLIIKPAPKSKAGFRVQHLPQWQVRAPVRWTDRHRARRCRLPGPAGRAARPEQHQRRPTGRPGPGRVRLGRHHTFRKTVATWMDEAGLSARAAADQLGHAQPSMTQDVYFGRKMRATGAAALAGSHRLTSRRSRTSWKDSLLGTSPCAVCSSSIR
jgi:integrase